MGLKHYVCILVFMISCHNKPKNILFPESESEFAPPVIKKLGKPKIINLKPLDIPLGEGKPDSIKTSEIENRIKPKDTPFITNERTLGKPEILSIKQPDTVYYFEEVDKIELQKKYFNKTFEKVKHPINKLVKPKTVILGQPMKVNCATPRSPDNAVLNIKFYSQKEGFVPNLIRCMCLDNNGNLWIGTGSGLFKLDGKEWWIYTVEQGLSNDIILSLTVSKDGCLIIGTAGGGLNVINFKNQIISHYTTMQGISNNDIRCLLEITNGTILIGTAGGGLNLLNIEKEILNVFNKDHGLNSKFISSLTKGNNGDVFIGTSGDGLNVMNFDSKSTNDFRPQTILHYNTTNGLQNNTIRCLKVSKEGDLLIGTHGGGLVIFDQKNQSIKQFKKHLGLSGNIITSIIESKDGNIYLGTENGLSLINFENKSVSNYTRMEGLSSNFTRCLAENEDGRILIGTDGGGLNILSEKDFKINHLDQNQGLSGDYILSNLESRDGRILLGVEKKGLNIIDIKNQKVKYYNVSTELGNDQILSLLECSNGKIMLGTSGSGLKTIDEKNEKISDLILPYGQFNNTIRCLLENSKGEILIGTDAGMLNILNQEKKKIRIYGKEFLNNNYMMCIIDIKYGIYLIGTYGDGFSILNESNNHIEKYSTKQGLAGNIVYCFLEGEDGVIFIGTSSGLSIIDFKSKIVKNYTTSQGLPNNNIVAIKKDNNGNIWLGTEAGLCKMVKINGDYVVQNNYDYREGLKFTDFNHNALLLTQKGSIWAGIGKTLTKFTYSPSNESYITNTYITAIDVKGCKINWMTNKIIHDNLFFAKPINQDTIWDSNQNDFFTNKFFPVDTSYCSKNKIFYQNVTKDIYHLPTNLVLPSSQNHLTFHFNNTCIAANTDRIRYRYILDGLDEKWSSITEMSEAEYRNIPPGKYIFKVVSRNIYGHWGKQALFAFEVLPPWHQAYWAYFIYTLVFISIIIVYSNWRHNKSRKFSKLIVGIQEEEKMKISRELHDDLGQQLSFIRINYILSDEVKKTIDDVIEKVRKISYDLRPIKIYKNDIKTLLENLILEIKSERIFFSYEIDQINNLNQDQKVNIYRITQEAINNILKHSKAQNARITFSKHNKALILEIMDDGVGFSLKDNYKSVGIFSMKERAALIDAKLEIKKLEKGTKIILTIQYE